MGGLKDRSEDTGGENARLAERRRAQAFDAAASARERIEILQPFSVVLPPTHLPAGRTVLAIDDVTAGYEPERPILRDLSFSITGPERVAVVGPNGSGKTTLLALVTGQLQPWSGSARVMTAFALLDQRVSLLDPSLRSATISAASIRRRTRTPAGRRSPGSCSGPTRLCRSSPRSAAGSCCGRGLPACWAARRPPSLLILDEPTNHLDIDSIEAVEAGLRAYDGALLVVSHDETFLDAIGISRRLDLGPVQAASLRSV